MDNGLTTAPIPFAPALLLGERGKDMGSEVEPQKKGGVFSVGLDSHYLTLINEQLILLDSSS